MTQKHLLVERVGVSKPTVIGWKKRYAADGIAGLEDRPKPGRPARVDEVAVVLATLEPPPQRLGVTHWSSRLLAEQLGNSNVWVARIWKRWGLQPWRRETFRFSTDTAPTRGLCVPRAVSCPEEWRSGVRG